MYSHLQKVYSSAVHSEKCWGQNEDHRGRLESEALEYLGLDCKSWDSIIFLGCLFVFPGKDLEQEEKGVTDDEMVR